MIADTRLAVRDSPSLVVWAGCLREFMFRSVTKKSLRAFLRFKLRVTTHPECARRLPGLATGRGGRGRKDVVHDLTRRPCDRPLYQGCRRRCSRTLRSCRVRPATRYGNRAGLEPTSGWESSGVSRGYKRSFLQRYRVNQGMNCRFIWSILVGRNMSNDMAWTDLFEAQNYWPIE